MVLILDLKGWILLNLSKPIVATNPAFFGKTDGDYCVVPRSFEDSFKGCSQGPTIGRLPKLITFQNPW